MALVHHNSAECCKSELDIFSIPPTQTQIQKGVWIGHLPTTNVTENGPIEFQIPLFDDAIDLSNTQLYVKVKIVKPDGQDLDPTSAVAPVNLFLHAMFTQIDMYISDRLISGGSNTYPYRAYLETILNQGEDSKNSWLAAELWHKDQAGRFDNLYTDADDVATAKVNSGWAKRREYVKGSKSFEMQGALHIDMLNQDRYMLNNTAVRFRFLRSKNDFCLMSKDDGAGYKVHIEEAVLYIRKATLSPAVQLAYAQALEKAPARYPITRVEVKNFTIPKGSWNINRDNLFLGSLPRRIVVGLVDSNAFNSDYKKNPFNFTHFDLKYLGVYIDGEQRPFKPLEPCFEKNLYMRSYLTLFEGIEKNEHGITRAKYPHGNALWVFNFTPDLGCENPMNLVKQGNLRVELRFAKELPAAVNCIILAEFDSVLELDKERNVVYDYSS